jgi:butyrate kinase
MREVRKRIASGDATARLIIEAMAYQIVKQIGASAAALNGDVQAVVLTGGLAADPDFTALIADRIRWIAPVVILPGEQEMSSLCQGSLRVLRNRETPKEY